MKIIPILGVSGALTAQILRDNASSFFLHSRYNPELEAERWIKEQLSHSRSEPIIVIGLGLGYHVEALARAVSSTEIIVLEGQPELVKLTHQRTNWVKPDNCRLITVYNKKDYLHALKHLIMLAEDEGTLLIHRTSIMALPEYWQDIKDILEDYLMRLDTNKRFYRLGEENWKQNSLLAIKGLGIGDLKRRWPEKLNLVIGSGPSLNEALEELKSWAGRLNLISVGSSTELLVRSGIKPDIRVFLDPQEKVANQITSRTQEIDSVVFATVHPAVVEKIKGNIYWAWQEGFDWGNTGRPPYLVTGGTVSAAALSLSFFLNKQPTLLVGVDLGYKNEKSHADGTMYGEIKAVLKNMREIPAVTGGTIRTSRNLDYYRKRIEGIVAASGRTVYNLGSGALIKGIQPITWNQLKGILGWN